MKVQGELLNEAALNTADVTAYWQYSGRFMFGRNYFGVVGDAGAATRFVVSVVDMARDNSEMQPLAEYFRSARFSHDSMGRDAIFYWESLEAVDEDGEPYAGGDDSEEDDDW